jgi:hypothetical protein
MRLRKVAIQLLCAVALFAVATVVPASAVSVAPVEQAYTVWTWNVAGWVIHRGSTTDGLIQVLANSIRNQGADFAAVNELCRNQYDAIRQNLRSTGWMQDENNFARLEDYHAVGDTVIIAGDFNAQPDYGRMNGWYSSSLDVPNNSNNTGHYRELDDTDDRCLGYGERTQTDPTGGPCGLGKKIDLIFVRENKLVGTYSGNSLSISSACGGPCSDHRIVTGTVTVRIDA